MHHISYKDLSPENFEVWVSAKAKILRSRLRNPSLTPQQREKILVRLASLSNKTLIQK